jgi:hypothetical protein
MGTALAVLVLAAAAVFGVWVLVKMGSIVRELMQVTTGLTGLGIEIGRVAQLDTAALTHRTSSSN